MTRDSVRRTSDLVQVLFEEIAIDLPEARFWPTAGWPLALIGNASGRTLPKGLKLDPRRFR